MEYLRELHSQTTYNFNDLVQALRELQVIIIEEAIQNDSIREKEIISELFLIANSDDYAMSNDMWNDVKIYIYSFIIGLTPNSTRIPNLNLHTSNVYLFFLVTVLIMMKATNQSPETIKQCLEKIKDNIFHQEPMSSFRYYVETSASYSYLLPGLISGLNPLELIKLFYSFFEEISRRYFAEASRDIQENNPNQNIPKINRQYSPDSIQFSYWIHDFFEQLLIQLKFHAPPQRHQILRKAAVILSSTLKYNIKASSTLIVRYAKFFQLFYEAKPYIQYQMNGEQLASILNENARFRHNDIFKYFQILPIYTFFKFCVNNENKKMFTSIVCFILQILFAPNQEEILHKFKKKRPNTSEPTMDQDFGDQFLKLYSKGHNRPPLFYFIEQLVTAFDSIAERIKDIKLRAIDSFFDPQYIFSKQSMIDDPIDDLLYSRIEYETYNTFSDAFEAFQKDYKHMEYFLNYIVLPSHFFFYFMQQEPFHQFDQITSPAPSAVTGQQSSLYFISRRLFASFFKMIIEFEYRFTLFSHFFCKELLTRILHGERFIFYRESLRNKYLNHLRRFWESYGTIQPFSEGYTRIVATLLYKATEEGKITHSLMLHLRLFPDQFVLELATHMLQIAYTNVVLADNLDIDQTHIFINYILFALQLMKIKGQHVDFSSVQESYVKIFSFILIRSRISNRRDYINFLVQYLQTLNIPKTTLVPNEMRQRMLIQPKQFIEITAPLILSPYIFEDKKTISGTFSLFVQNGFKSHDPSLIHRALNKFLPPFFSRNGDQQNIKCNYVWYFDTDIDSNRGNYTQMFKSVKYANNDDQLLILRSIPLLYRLFHSWKNEIKVAKKDFVVERYNTNLDTILQNILFKFDQRFHNAVNVFLFLNTLIHSDLFNQNLTELPVNALRILISDLFSLLIYPKIRSQVLLLFDVLMKKFIDMVNNGNTNYLMALMLNIRSEFAETDALYIMVFSRFVDHMKLQSKEYATQYIKRFISLSREINNINSLMAIFLYFQEKWPGCITPDLLSLFLCSFTSPGHIQHLEVFQHLFANSFNRFLKRYVSELTTDEEKFKCCETFIKFIHAKELNYSLRSILIKRMYKGHFPPVIRNFSLKNLDDSLFFLILSSILATGTTSNEPIPKEVVIKSFELLSNPKRGVPDLIKMHINFILMVLKTQSGDSPFYQNLSVSKDGGNSEKFNFIDIISKYISKLANQTSNPHITKKITKCINLLKMKNPQFHILVPDMRSKLNQTRLDDPHLKFFLHAASRVANDLPHQDIDILLGQFESCLQIPKEEVFMKMPEIIGFIHFFSNINYDNPANHEFMLLKYNSQNYSRLSLYLHICVNLINDYSYPSFYNLFDDARIVFWYFQQEIVDIILRKYDFIEDIDKNFEFLYQLANDDWIIEPTMQNFDKEIPPNRLFNIILNKLSILFKDEKLKTTITNIHVHYFKIINRFSKNPKYVNKNNFIGLIYNSFQVVMKMYEYFSYCKSTILALLMDSIIELLQYDPLQIKYLIFIANCLSATKENTALYKKFKRLIFENRDRQFYTELFLQVIDKEDLLPTVTEILLVQLLKGLKCLDQEKMNDKDDLNAKFLTFMGKMIHKEEQLTCVMGCFLIYFKYNAPTPESYRLIFDTLDGASVSKFGEALQQPSSYCILHALKIAVNILGGPIYYHYNTINPKNSNPEDYKNVEDVAIIAQFKNDPPSEKVNPFHITLLSHILQHILLFPLFMDTPYRPYVITLLIYARKVFHHVDLIPHDLKNRFRHFVLLSTLKFKDMDYVLLFAKHIPIFFETLPFSIPYSMFHALNLNLHQLRPRVFLEIKPEDYVTACLFVGKYSEIIHLPPSEEQYVFTTIFRHFEDFIFNGKDGIIPRNLSDQFMITVMHKGRYLESDLLQVAQTRYQKIQKMMQNEPTAITFSRMIELIVVSCVEDVKIEYILKHKDFIAKCFEQMLIVKLRSDISAFIKIYTVSIFNRPEIFADRSLIDHFYQVLRRNTAESFKYRLDMLFAYVKFTNDDKKLATLKWFWDNIPVNLSDCFTYQLFIKLIPFLSPQEQKEYMLFILEKMANRINILYPFWIPFFIESPKVSFGLKMLFLREYLPAIIGDFELIFIQKLLESIKKFEFCPFESEVLLLFFSIVNGFDSSKAVSYSQLQQVIGQTPIERFINLATNIPPFLWRNSIIFYFAIVILGSQNELDLPLLLLGNAMGSMSEDFLTKIFIDLTNAQTTPLMFDLLAKVQLSDPNLVPKPIEKFCKTPDQYSYLVSAILKAFHHHSIPIDPNLLYKSMKITNDFSLFEKMQLTTPLIPDKLLLPHKLNDVIYGLTRDDISLESMAAVSQFFLGNYEESEKIFNKVALPENQVVARINQITTDIMYKYQNFLDPPNSREPTKFDIYKRYMKNDYSIVGYLETAYNKLLSKKDCKDDLTTSELNNLSYFTSHFHPSYYEKQRISSLESIIMLMHTKIPTAKSEQENTLIAPELILKEINPTTNFVIESCFPPVFSNAIIQFAKEGIKNEPKNKQLNNNSENKGPFLVFSSEIRPFFDCNVIHYGFHGFFAVDSTTTFDTFNNIYQKMAKNEQETSQTISRFIWPSFCFNLFASTQGQSRILFRITLDSYAKLLAQYQLSCSAPVRGSFDSLSNPSQVCSKPLFLPPFVHHASFARILSLINYAQMNQIEKPELYQEAEQCIATMAQYDIISESNLWMPQIVQLCDIPSFRKLLDKLGKSSAFIATNLAHDNDPAAPKTEADAIRLLAKLISIVFSLPIECFVKSGVRKTIDDIDLNNLSKEQRDSIKQFSIFLEELNRKTPFFYDRRILSMKIGIIHFNSDFCRINDNCITFSGILKMPPYHQHFIIERVTNTDTAVTFSNVFECIRNIFKYDYSSRLRRIKLSSSLAMEIGNKYILHSIPEEIESVANSDRVNRQILALYSQKDYFKLRRALIQSFAANSIMRNMFSLNQPSEDDVFLSLKSGEFPVFVKDFSIPTEFAETAVLLNSEIINVFGPTWRGELQLALSAVSSALAKHIEMVRSLIEMPIIGLYEQREKKLDAILSKRDWIENAIISFAPPKFYPQNMKTEEQSTEEFVQSSMKWIQNVDKFISNSMSQFDRKIYDLNVMQPNTINVVENKNENDLLIIYHNTNQVENDRDDFLTFQINPTTTVVESNQPELGFDPTSYEQRDEFSFF